MKSFAQVVNSFNLNNASTPIEVSYAALVLALLAANQTSLESVKGSMDTLVTDLGDVPEAADELTAAEAIQTTLSGLVTAGTSNPFQQVINSLSDYKGSLAYNHLVGLLHERAQSFKG